MRVRLSNLMPKPYCTVRGRYIERDHETEARVRHYLLIYHLKDDYLERRPRFREEHLALAKEFAARGELVLGGALEDPTDLGVLLFQGDSPAAAERFVELDPYVSNGLIERWEVRPWTTVVGKDAAHPV